ncbi:hypothetical protein [Endozoicomonas ascidiicola]|uniref:hypothetical protein n=1 Tax=Endozoicomonas ascidiicola TaxID=1698521 RepID=UPI000831809B|nr:hypothetical protein [Endozoicomonas ascidiicola]
MNYLTEEDYVLDLIERLTPYLPMVAHPGKGLIASYRQSSADQPKIKFRKDHKLIVTAAHYLGDEGGLSLAYASPVSGDGYVMVTSITHLKLDPKHPLYKELRTYQLARVSRLQKQGGKRLPSNIFYDSLT